MPWWAWIVFGALLLVVELGLVDAEFYLVFLGVSALSVGLLAAAGPLPSAPAQWIAFAVISLVCLVGFRRRLYHKLRGNLPGFEGTIVGQRLVLQQALAPGEECRAEVRGTTWTVRNAGDDAIEPGTQVRVEEADGLLLDVKRAG